MPLDYRWSNARKDLVAGLTVAAICAPQAMAYALVAGIDPRFGLYSAIVVTAVASVFGSSSHLINGPTNAISLVVFSALAVVGPNRFLRERRPDDPHCSRMAILDLEGELFFGAAPELDRYFTELKEKTKDGLRIVVLRVKRTRNPDMVCMERFQHFLRDMEHKKVPVLLCGVRSDFDRAMKNLGFDGWLPIERIFREDANAPGTATLTAVRHAYDLLGDDLCDTCPRRHLAETDHGPIDYVI